MHPVAELFRRGHRVQYRSGVFALALVVLATWWVGPTHTWDGPVLFHLTRGHGVHVGDLPAIPALAVAVWLTLARVIPFDRRARNRVK